MMPFSPFSRKPTSRSSASRSSYRSFSSWISRSASSSIWRTISSDSFVPRSKLRFIFSRRRTSSRSFAENSSVSSSMTRSWRSTSKVFCSSHFSLSESFSAASAWYRSTSASIFFWYASSVALALSAAESADALSSSSNLSSCSFFVCDSASYRDLSPSSSAWNLSVRSLILAFMSASFARISRSFCSVSSETCISSACVLARVSSMSALVTRTSSEKCSLPARRAEAPSLSRTSNTDTQPSSDATNSAPSS
mmetsp:Transcript_10568/g.44973  ORF Transcript_10568/g.44973 Transcript_10568/m.44973 type:complete len:252 (-) Transcript_10568:2055-2810(-)